MNNRIWSWFSFAAIWLVVAGAQTSLATVRTVAASGGGSNTTIQAAINASSPGDTIRIIQSPHTESNVTISVNGKGLTIEGLGADETVVQAGATPGTAGQRIFNITAKGTLVQFRDLTLQNGNPADTGGGAILVSTDYGPSRNDTVTVTRCWFKDNISRGGGAAAAGGAIRADKTLLIVSNCTFSGNILTNYTSGGGGAVSVGGYDGLVVRNSTFSSNAIYFTTSWQYGGALALSANTAGGGRVDNCTFYGNRAAYAPNPTGWSGGGGLSVGNAIAESCVFDNNVSAAGADMYGASYTNCVYESAPSGGSNLGGNVLTNNARVSATLADNGGRMPTHALLASSAAINHGSNPAGLSYDQRGAGYAREVPAGAPDCGAFEYLAGPVALTYSTNTFSELMPDNNGSIDNAVPMRINITGNEMFAASINVGTEVLVSNLPANLTAVFTRDNGTQLSVTLTGQATAHANANAFANLEFAFQDAAFTVNSAASVSNSTRSDLQINFEDAALPPELTYYGTGFSEAPANDGSIATTFIIDLANGTFAGDIGTNYVLGGEVVVNNLPAGLAAVVQKSGVREVTVSLTGNASAHNAADGIANLEFDFQDAALASGDASALVNDPRSNLTISYIDPVLTYNGTGAFAETNANNGAIGNAFTITLVGDSFTGSVNDDFADGSGEVTVGTPPSGLAWKVNRDSATQLTVSFTGNATAQNAADSVTGLALSFNDSAFTASTATVVTNNSKSNYSISFQNPTLSYSAAAFYESLANDGAVPDTATITLAGDSFTGSNGDDFAGDEVSVANVPAGLTAKLARTSPTLLTVSFTGNASPHDAAANRTDVTFAFGNAAFTGNIASIVTNNTKSNLSVLFRESYYVNQALGSDANDGTANDAAHAWATLTNAVARAAANSVINIMSSPHMEKDVAVNKGMVFKGQGADQTVLLANADPWTGTGRVFNVTAASGTVAIQDMTLRNGRATGGTTAGGAIYAGVSGSSLMLLRCSFEQNESEGYGGGAVYVNGPLLTVRDCMFQQNIAINNIQNNGAFGGAISASGPSMTIANSTFSENKAKGAYGWQGGGGAIAAYPAAGYYAGIYNCTFHSNSLPTSEGQGGAIRGGTRDRVTVYSCVFARNNIAGSTTEIFKGSSMSECGVTNSVYQDAFVTYYATMYDLGGNISTNNARLDPVLAANGGPTMTHALLEGSAAIDTGINPLGLEYDQRGRPYARVVGVAVDCGAYEFGAGAAMGTIIILQ